MKDSKKLRTIIFNILVILTILFIYFLFFPKKSYVKEKLDDNLSPLSDETFKENINAMKIASSTYFNSNENKTVTLQELIDQNLLAELKDSRGEACSTTSYVERTDEMIKIHLDCNDKSGDRYISLKDDKFLCIYQYEKKIESGYTEWSEWSEWSTNQIEGNEYTNVETEIRKEPDGTKTEIETKEETIAATSSTKRVQTDTINATIQYYCEKGYELRNGKCYKGNSVKNSYASFSCPANTNNTEYVIDGSKCKVYSITRSGYSCPSGYNLSGSTCYRTVNYEKEVENYKDVTYYRYQTREKTNEKIDTKWSIKDDYNLLNDSYNMVGKISCEF